MKVKLISIFVILITATLCSAQKKNEVRLFGGFVGSDVLGIAEDGGGSSNNDNTFEFGIKYLRNITDDLCIETGYSLFKTETKLEYSDGKVEKIKYEDVKVIQIPLLANYTFNKYFFLNGGFIITFDKSNGSQKSQSGIGYNLGFGAKYAIKNFVFYINPNLKRCASFISFENERYDNKLTELGIEFGIGYRF